MAIHALRAFRHRNFRYYFCGQSLSMVGTWIQQIAMSWLVYRLTDSPFLLGVTAFAGQIPILVLGALGGVWSDRVDRHKLMVITQWLALAQGIGAEATLFAGGICCCLGGLLLLRQLPRLRRNIRPIYIKLGIVRE